MEKKTSAKKAAAPKKTTASAAPKKKKVEAAASAPKAPRAKKETSARKRAGGKCCTVKGCNRAYKAKGYCKPHYRMWRHGKFAKARYKACKDYGCFKPMAMNRHGLCETHYQNFYVKGLEMTHAPAAAAPAKADKAEESAA